MRGYMAKQLLYNRARQFVHSPFGFFLDRLMPLCHPNIIDVFSTNITKRAIVMEKVARDLHALLNDKRVLDNTSGEKMVR